MQKRISLDLVFDEMYWGEGSMYYELRDITLSYSEIDPAYREYIVEQLAHSTDLIDEIAEAIGTGEAVEFK